mgnify:CR=1 FL=1
MKYSRTPQNWLAKFRCAISGLVFGFREQRSFRVHLPCAVVVVALAVWLDLERMPFCTLLLCVGIVLGAELLNTGLEYLARAVTDEVNEDVRRALDVSGGAVLMVALVAAIVGLVILVPPILEGLSIQL